GLRAHRLFPEPPRAHPARGGRAGGPRPFSHRGAAAEAGGGVGGRETQPAESMGFALLNRFYGSAGLPAVFVAPAPSALLAGVGGRLLARVPTETVPALALFAAGRRLYRAEPLRGGTDLRRSQGLGLARSERPGGQDADGHQQAGEFSHLPLPSSPRTRRCQIQLPLERSEAPTRTPPCRRLATAVRRLDKPVSGTTGGGGTSRGRT